MLSPVYLQALKQLPREEVQLATKFGISHKPDWSEVFVRGSPAYVRECCEASLKRLDVDYIDLYYQHRVDTSVPIEDTVSSKGSSIYWLLRKFHLFTDTHICIKLLTWSM